VELHMSSVPHLLLAGCGHSHLFVLEALARGEFPPVRVTLVSPAEEYFYSGMESGMTAGQYQAEQARFRPPLLARAAGAEWVCAAVARIDANEGRVILLDDGLEIEYDLLSLNVGARLQGDDLPGVSAYACPVKPVRDAVGLGETAMGAVRQSSNARPARIVIVGGGAAGVETALCVSARLSHRFGPERYEVIVVHGGETALAEHPEPVRRRLGNLLRDRRIQLRLGARAHGVDDARVLMDGGAEIPYDVLVWATGPQAPALFRESALAVDERGYLRVQTTLQAERCPAIFAAGDCVALLGFPDTPKAGVYAVREGPVLVRNLAHSLRGWSLERYEPQENWLSLLNTGDGRALMSYRGYAAQGRALWWLKDAIDRRFMRRFQTLEGSGEG
jgi:pyridine nucleotide-disulfide oxidoreductase family protein